ncbi:MAG TPA: cupin domain-containing protein [Solirubrobacterales bacterium]|nr:cupin domain-containing protein [Solirubrobacterales bacterium]
MTQQLLDIEADRLVANFSREPFGVHHHLADHELLSVEALAQLAETLPSQSVEHNLGNVDVVAGNATLEVLDQSPGEVARNIETNGCWLLLRNIEQSPAYRQLLDDTLNEVDPLVRGREGGMNLREGFVFLSAPHSTTPAHTDHEHNFLLQVRGTKQMNIGRFADAEVEQRHLEEMFAGMPNLDQLPSDPVPYDLAPGDGVYVPPNVPHWVVNGPAVSVSLSITFRTPVTERGGVVHTVNRRLRKVGIKPRPPGEHLATDRAKLKVHRGLKTLLRR